MRISDIDNLPHVLKSRIKDKSTIAIGGQNLTRMPARSAYEISRLEISELTIVGCNVSFPAEILSLAGCVSTIECGSLNFEVFGMPPGLLKLLSDGAIRVRDFDHLTIVLRLLAGQMALPFIPINSIAGTSLVDLEVDRPLSAFRTVQNPWNPGQAVVLVEPLRPDACILHAQCADSFGNIYLAGALCADDDLVKASATTIVTCEELLDPADARQKYGGHQISGDFIDEVVIAPRAGMPGAVPMFYDYDENFFQRYTSGGRKEKNVSFMKNFVSDYLRTIFGG